jgi:Fe-S-cluster-containing dehydrogenase component
VKGEEDMEQYEDRDKMKDKKGLTRRDFLLGATGFAVAAGAVAVSASAQSTDKVNLEGKELAMVIDLQRCTGCGACAIACKSENNVQDGVAWAWHEKRTTGTFPNVHYEYIPTLCNHCKDAPCVRLCPTKAMHKEDGGITAHTPEKCIGCKSCIAACPYKVITPNKKEPHKNWKSDEQLFPGASDSPKEIAEKVGGDTIPLYNPDRERYLKGSGLRYKGIVEKCTFCDHRVTQGKLPYCVERCPAKARIFGDLNDPESKVNEILSKYSSKRLREYLGTEPKVYYVREFNPATYRKSKGSI